MESRRAKHVLIFQIHRSPACGGTKEDYERRVKNMALSVENGKTFLTEDVFSKINEPANSRNKPAGGQEPFLKRESEQDEPSKFFPSKVLDYLDGRVSVRF
jgi:hypothetical protein